jgi:chemotaxis protein MotC
VTRIVLSAADAMALLAAPGLAEEAPAREPAELVRALRIAQDRIAQGEGAQSQRALLVETAEQLAKARESAWKEPRNARAAVAFVLSGGDPRVLRRVLALGPLAGMDVKLVQGVLAYAEGRQAEALDLLSPIDARLQDGSLAGHVALIQAELVAKKDTRRAAALLDDARLLAPGTLIEEAALRRQATLAATVEDRAQLDALSMQYLRRFPRSAYAAGFRRQFAADVAAKPGVDDARLGRLEAALAGLDAGDRRELYLMVAKEALVKGRAELVRFAAPRAAALAGADSAERVRAGLYEAAALATGDAPDKAAVALAALSKGGLEAEDGELLEAAAGVAEAVATLPGPSATLEAAQREEAMAGMAGAELARRAIARVDQMLSEVIRK